MFLKYKLLVLFLCFAVALSAQTTEQLIDKHLAAIGGEQKWNTVHNYLLEGVRNSEGLEVQEKKQVVLQKSMRIDYLYKSRDPSFKNKKYFLIINANQGWKYLPDNAKDSIEKLSVNDVAYYRHQMNFEDPFINARDRNIKIVFLNKEFILEKEYYKCTLSHPSGLQEYVYLDLKTHLIYKRVFLDANSEQEYTYEQYELLENGLVIPTAISSLVDEFKILQFKINVPIDASIFKIQNSNPLIK